MNSNAVPRGILYNMADELWVTVIRTEIRTP